MSAAGGIVTRSYPMGGFELSEERSYQALRRALAEDGYLEPMHIESLPLVKKLYDDFSALKETRRALESSLSDKTANEARMQRQFQPVQKELARMVRENNQLHLEMIQRGEEVHAHQQKESMRIKALDQKLADASFVIAQQAGHIKELEQQLDAHRDRMQGLLDPHFTCTSAPAGDVQPKGALITMTSCPRPVQLPIEPVKKQHRVDLAYEATQQIQGLQDRVTSLENELQTQATEVDQLTLQVKNRETEIARMGKLLEVNINSDKEELERENAEQGELIRRLQDQIDLVSGHLAGVDDRKKFSEGLESALQAARAREQEAFRRLSVAEDEIADLRALLQRAADDAAAAADEAADAVAAELRGAHAVPSKAMQAKRDAAEARSEAQARAEARAEARRRQEEEEEEAAAAAAAEMEELEGLEDELAQAEAERREEQTLKLAVALQESEALLERSEEEVARLRAALDAKGRELDAAARRVDSMQGELSDVSRMRDSLYAVVMEFETQVGDVQGQIRGLDDERRERVDEASRATEQLRAAQAELARARRTIESLEAGGGGKGGDASVEALNQIEPTSPSKAARTGAGRSASAEAGRTRVEELEAQVRAEAEHRAGLQGELRAARLEAKRLEVDLARAEGAAAELRGERDALLAQLERHAGADAPPGAEARLRAATAQHEQAVSDLTACQQQAEMLRQALQERDAQGAVLARQLAEEAHRAQQAERLGAARAEEVRVLTVDLGAMTRENQVVNDELAGVAAHKDALKRDLSASLERLAAAEQLVRGRERERDDVMQAYRALVEEKARAEAACERTLMEVHESKSVVHSREEELQRAREMLAVYESDQHRLQLDLQALQRHAEQLSERVVAGQSQAKREAAEVAAVHRELEASKGVSALLEQQKRDALRECALLRDEVVALRGRCEQAAAEKEVAFSRWEAERAKVRDLEEVLLGLRQREAGLSAAATTDSARLAEQVSVLEGERAHLAAEVRVLNARGEELERELLVVRSQSASMNESGNLSNVSEEVQLVVEQQNAALRAKQAELAELRSRLGRMQQEAEANERTVLQLEARLAGAGDAGAGELERARLELEAREGRADEGAT